jgi:hypothetical protein
MTDFESVQKFVIKYFDDNKISNKDLIDFIHNFCYLSHQNMSIEGNKAIEKFFKDNDLEDVFIRYMKDLKRKINNEDFLFYSTTMSERGLIEDIRISLFVLSAKRLEANINEKVIKPKNTPILKSIKKVKLIVKSDDIDPDIEVHIENTINSEYTLCGTYVYADEFADNFQNSKDKITCRHCLMISNDIKTHSIT